MQIKAKICALVLARGGSKRLPGKNIKEFAGRPLITWTINAAIEAGKFDRIFCYTDDDAISSISIKAGAEVPFERPLSVSEDATSSIETAICFLKQLHKCESYYPDWIVLLQPTSPFRNSRHITESLDLVFEGGGDSLISVKKIKTTFKNIRFISGGKLIFLKSAYSLDNTSDLYAANGAIYIIKVSSLNDYKSFSTPNTVPYVMDEIESIDIDTMEDFIIAENIFKTNDECN